MIMKMLRIHNNCFVLLEAINGLFKIKFGFYYYLLIPFIDMFIIILLDRGTNIYFRIIAILILIAIISSSFYFTLFVASINKMVHQLYSELHSTIAQNSSKMSNNLKYK